MNTEPLVSVGILHAPSIRFALHGTFLVEGGEATGEQEVKMEDGRLRWEGRVFDTLTFSPREETCTFTLHQVEIGIKFHWQRREDETFEGTLRFIVDEQQVCAVNVIKAERYLIGVGASEMKASAPPEYVKAQVVIARSWLLAQRHPVHAAFDVCADDHCQRYQGIGRQTNSTALDAVRATRGEVLTYGGRICDARYSKCCGGISEVFSTCWEDVDVPYLQSELCAPHGEAKNCSEETAAQSWIASSPSVCCNVRDQRILRLILNDYDQETTDFFRWTVKYSVAELSRIVNARLPRPVGEVRHLVPLRRGPSGRISLLRIIGSEGSADVGKELAIRQLLSASHLKSSAFFVERTSEGFVLHGAGWGHGVGLCQIGAAAMALQGHADYKEILLHYYRGATIQQYYQ